MWFRPHNPLNGGSWNRYGRTFLCERSVKRRLRRWVTQKWSSEIPGSFPDTDLVSHPTTQSQEVSLSSSSSMYMSTLTDTYISFSLTLPHHPLPPSLPLYNILWPRVLVPPSVQGSIRLTQPFDVWVLSAPTWRTGHWWSELWVLINYKSNSGLYFHEDLQRL